VKDPLVAELAYRETVAARERVRGVRRAITLPLRLLATVNFVGATVVMIIGQFHMLAYFAPAYLVVLTISGWWYRHYATRHGLLLPVWPWVAILAASLTVGASMSRLGVALDKSWISDYGAPLAFVAGMALTAGWLRSRRLGHAAIGMALSSALVYLVASGDLAVALQLTAFGALLWHASWPADEHEDSP
jgi:hypothetical protein